MFSLMQYPWYRWLRVLGGSRSFKKINKFGMEDTYAIIKGQKVEKVVEELLKQGFVEEWASSDLPGNRMDRW